MFPEEANFYMHAMNVTLYTDRVIPSSCDNMCLKYALPEMVNALLEIFKEFILNLAS